MQLTILLLSLLSSTAFALPAQQHHHHHHNNTTALEKKHTRFGWVGSFADSRCYGAVSAGDAQNLKDPDVCYPFNPVPNQKIGINFGGGSEYGAGRPDAVRFFTDTQCQHSHGSSQYVHQAAHGDSFGSVESGSPCVNYDPTIKAVKMFFDPDENNENWSP